MTHLSDEFLLAYIDGQLERSQAQGVMELASANAEIGRRINKLKRTQVQLLEAFGSFARETISVPDIIENETRKKPAPRNPDKIAAIEPATDQKNGRGRFAFVVVVFLGGLIGGYGAHLALQKQAAPLIAKTAERPPVIMIPAAAWPSDLARFHAFFPRETLTPHPDAISNVELIRFQLTKVAGKALTPPDFTRQGYTLFRGQVFNYNQERMMQLTYSSKTEAPLTLYVAPATGSTDSPLTPLGSGSSKAVSWVNDRIRFFLTADKEEEDLKLLAVMAQSQITKRIP